MHTSETAWICITPELIADIVARLPESCRMKAQFMVCAGEFIEIDVDSPSDASEGGSLVGKTAVRHARRIRGALNNESDPLRGKRRSDTEQVAEEILTIVCQVRLGVVSRRLILRWASAGECG